MFFLREETNGDKPVVVRQPRRRRGRGRGNGYRSYASREYRAAMAAGMVRKGGWTARRASRAFCVCQSYVQLACRLNDEDLARLAIGDLKLSVLWKEYLKRLAERRAQATDTKVDELIGPMVDPLVARHGVDRVKAAFNRVKTAFDRAIALNGNGTRI